LTQLFERVRYGGGGPDARAENEAMSCLEAIIEAYGTPDRKPA
jgi:hypothetical protein